MPIALSTLDTISMFGSPGLLLIMGGLLMPFVPQRLRDGVAIVFPLLVLFDIWQLKPGDSLTFNALGHQFHLLQVHAYSTIFATAFALAALGGVLFAVTYNRRIELSAAFIYAGGALCVVYAGDLMTVLIFWEIMAIASTIVVWTGNTIAARHAGMRYAAMHFLGGVLMMEGITTYIGVMGDDQLVQFAVHVNGFLAGPLGMDAAIAALTDQQQFLVQLSTWLILLGILVNLAAPPFSAWLADAYPEASPSGTIFLSAFTTKSAVYLLMTLFPGNNLLIWVGMFMIFYGIIYAMLENNIRRILSYSIVNQVGFMTVAIGIGTPLALMGAAAHAFCHIAYKALLMMSAGAVIQQTGKHLCSEVGGLYHSMKLTCICGIIGALAISAFPLTSGFISKSMISTAAADQHLFWVWLGLLAASAGVFLHAGIKFPWFVFFQRDSGLRPADPNLPMRIGMVLFSAICILPGIWPELVYNMLPTMPDYEPNTLPHWVTQLQLLLFSGLAFFLMLPLLQRTRTISLDIDWLWRVPLLNTLRYIEWLGQQAVRGIIWLTMASFYRLRDASVRNCGLQGIFARTATSGATLMWVSVLLGVYLLVYYGVG